MGLFDKKKQPEYVDISNINLSPQQFQSSYNQVQNGTANIQAPQTATKTPTNSQLLTSPYLLDKSVVTATTSNPQTQTQNTFQQANPFQTKPLDLSGITNITDSQKKRLATSNQNTNNYLNNLYSLTNQSLKNQIPGLQTAFDQFKGNTEASIADQTAATDKAKMAAEERFGTAQRQGAMTRRESEGRLMNKFAANNALNSYGAGSYTNAASKLESDFNTFTQENIQNKLNQFDELDRELLNFTRQANYLIQTEEQKLKSAIEQINTQVGMNDLEKQYKMQQAYDEYQSKVGDIDSYIEGLKLQQQQLGQSLAQEYTLLQQLSPEFKATGQPKTDADMLWVQKYPDAYKQLLEGNKQTATAGQQGQVTQNILSVVDDLLSSQGLGQITGTMQLRSNIPGTQGSLSKNLYNQLKGMLSLENRQALKGSGAISDFEARVLEQAASALDRNLSEDQFRLVLQNIKNQLATGSRQPLGATQDQKLQQLASILGTGNTQGSW